MKITAVRGVPLRCACEPISDALSTSRARQALLVLLDTDTGLQGIGEAFTYGAPLAVMKYLVENTLGPKLIGRDPADIDGIWQTLYISTLASGRRSMTLGAISGIDIALWDLKGKCEHKPIAALLGGTRDRIPSYASGGFYAHGKGLDGLRRELEGYMQKGYTDAKIKIGRNLDRPHAPLKVLGITEDTVTVEEDWQRIRAAKEIVGEGRLAVDTNASWDRAAALENAPRLVEAGVSWLEEPIPFEDMQGLTLLCRSNPGLQIVGCETQQGPAISPRCWMSARWMWCSPMWVGLAALASVYASALPPRPTAAPSACIASAPPCCLQPAFSWPPRCPACSPWNQRKIPIR